MPEENSSKSDASESEETFSVGGSLELRRWSDQQLKLQQEALAANGYKPFKQEEGNYEVASLEEFGEALRRAHESPIQLDPFEPDEYW